jgi:hypothetical protein
MNVYNIIYIMNSINDENEITYTNHKVKDYIFIIFENNKCNEICTRMTINKRYGPNRRITFGYNSKDVKIAKIDYCPS